MVSDDQELLRAFAETGAEDAFRCLVERHGAMVYGVARRSVGNHHLAEEITQAVFVILLRKARSVAKDRHVGGWLHRAARLVSLEALRREREFALQRQKLSSAPNEGASVWAKIEPLLDESIERLPAKEREAIILRFLEGESFAQVAEEARTTEAAAKMRVARALEKLRVSLGRQGASIGSAALSSAMTAEATHAAALSPALASHVMTGGSVGTNHALVQSALRALAWEEAKFAALLCGSMALIGGFILAVTNAFPQPAVKTLAPLTGRWSGTIESSTGASGTTQQVHVVIQPHAENRSCEIAMRVSNPGLQQTNNYQFVHSLNEAGDRIVTRDDPQIALCDGPGKITENHSTDDGHWLIAFRTPHANGSGVAECRWERVGNTLVIRREDRSSTEDGETTLITTLKLKKE